MCDWSALSPERCCRSFSSRSCFYLFVYLFLIVPFSSFRIGIRVALIVSSFKWSTFLGERIFLNVCFQKKHSIKTTFARLVWCFLCVKGLFFSSVLYASFLMFSLSEQIQSEAILRSYFLVQLFFSVDKMWSIRFSSLCCFLFKWQFPKCSWAKYRITVRVP